MKHENDQYGAINKIAKKLQRGLYPYPLIIEIQPSIMCNKKCDYCFWNNTSPSSEDRKDIMSLECYETLFREMKNLRIQKLSISGGGEPFLDSRMSDILKLARMYELEVRVVTNGSILPVESILELMYCKEIRFSIDAIKPSTYSEIGHVPENVFWQTLHNLNKLINLKIEKSSSISIGTSFLINKKNYSEAEEFCKHMLNLNIDAIIIKYDIYGTHGIPEEKLNEIEAKIRKIDDPRIELRERISLNDVKGTKCFIPYFKVAINPYGDLYSCCLGSSTRGRNGYFLGNLHDNSFKGIWDSTKPVIRGLARNGVACSFCNYTDFQINKVMLRAMEQ